jgi:hypothetical protein
MMPAGDGPRWHRVPKRPHRRPAWVRVATVAAYGIGALVLIVSALQWLVLGLSPEASKVVDVARPAALGIAFAAAVAPLFARQAMDGGPDLRFAHPLAAWIIAAALLLELPWRQVEVNARWAFAAGSYAAAAGRIERGELKPGPDGFVLLKSPFTLLSRGGNAAIRNGDHRRGVLFYTTDPFAERTGGLIHLSDDRPPGGDLLPHLDIARRMRPHWYYVEFDR